MLPRAASRAAAGRRGYHSQQEGRGYHSQQEGAGAIIHSRRAQGLSFTAGGRYHSQPEAAGARRAAMDDSSEKARRA